MKAAVFRIRDILIRIRILGSARWITDPDPNLAPDRDPAPDTALHGIGSEDVDKT
jgi:hypothetical protein